MVERKERSKRMEIMVQPKRMEGEASWLAGLALPENCHGAFSKSLLLSGSQLPHLHTEGMALILSNSLPYP